MLSVPPFFRFQYAHSDCINSAIFYICPKGQQYQGKQISKRRRLGMILIEKFLDRDCLNRQHSIMILTHLTFLLHVRLLMTIAVHQLFELGFQLQDSLFVLLQLLYMFLFFIQQLSLEFLYFSFKRVNLISLLVFLLNYADFLISTVQLPYLSSKFLGNFADMRYIDIVSISIPFFPFLQLQIQQQYLLLVILHHLLNLMLQSLSSTCLLLQLPQQIALHLCGIFMHVVTVVSFFVVLTNVIDHLHILVVEAFEDVFSNKLHAESVLEDQSDVLAALRQSNEEGGIETIFLSYFLWWRSLLMGQFIDMSSEQSQLRKRLLAFLEYSHDKFLRSAIILFHLIYKANQSSQAHTSL